MAEGLNMKLARYQVEDGQFWGEVNVEAQSIRRILGELDEWAPGVTESGRDALRFEGSPVALSTVRLLAPLAPTAEILGTGVNYATHALPRFGADMPYYIRPHSAVVGPEETLIFPKLIKIQPKCRFSYELELVAVIGREITDMEHPMRSLLGYTVGNDGRLVFQRPNFIGMDMTGSKCGYKGSAIGPWIVTKDELGGEAQPDLEMTMRIDGVITQQARTSSMNKGVASLLNDIDLRVGLKAGDIIYTGTPGYIGMDTGYYSPGALIEAQIQGIGLLRNFMEKTEHVPLSPVTTSAHKTGWR
jgi:2-keto-4-pentenoate hydratase/2-oxohepta-3-ene-1,7-dioic acid hydratase in catechol pathway